MTFIVDNPQAFGTSISFEKGVFERKWAAKMKRLVPRLTMSGGR